MTLRGSQTIGRRFPCSCSQRVRVCSRALPAASFRCATRIHPQSPALCRKAVAAGLGGRRAAQSRQLLVGIEIALVTMLLASAGLLLHSFVNLMGADRGYQVERVLTVDLSLFGQRYDSGEKCIAFYRTLSEQVRELPGVRAAGTISDLPAVAGSSGASRRIFFSTDADFDRAVLARPVAMIRSVTTGYFAASGTRLLSGRTFGDIEPVPVAVISQSLARSLWPERRPADVIGQTIRQGNVTGDLILVAGVVADVRSGARRRRTCPRSSTARTRNGPAVRPRS